MLGGDGPKGIPSKFIVKEKILDLGEEHLKIPCERGKSSGGRILREGGVESLRNPPRT
jgi:hypothetical protein